MGLSATAWCVLKKKLSCAFRCIQHLSDVTLLSRLRPAYIIYFNISVGPTTRWCDFPAWALTQKYSNTCFHSLSWWCDFSILLEYCQKKIVTGHRTQHLGDVTLFTCLRLVYFDYCDISLKQQTTRGWRASAWAAPTEDLGMYFCIHYLGAETLYFCLQIMTYCWVQQPGVSSVLSGLCPQWALWYISEPSTQVILLFFLCPAFRKQL